MQSTDRRHGTKPFIGQCVPRAESELTRSIAVLCLSEQGRADEAKQREPCGWDVDGDVATSWQCAAPRCL
jgi:hypothetical protein